jgi:hypothetical protein
MKLSVRRSPQGEEGDEGEDEDEGGEDDSGQVRRGLRCEA